MIAGGHEMTLQAHIQTMGRYATEPATEFH